MKTKTATVLMSGGIDSTCCAYLLQKQGYQVSGLFVDFGQFSAPIERRAVDTLAKRLSVDVSICQIAAGKKFGSGELLGRNAFLIFAAMLMGDRREGLLAIGVHAGTPYYDCSPAFISRLAPAVSECSNGLISLSAPFLNWSKGEVYSLFLTTGIPLSETYSCELGGLAPCGECSSCKDRSRLECSLNAAR